MPLWVASEKQETAARTIRPKITRLLPTYFTEFPMVIKQEKDLLKFQFPPNDWAMAQTIVDKQQDVPEVTWCEPGEEAALVALDKFTHRLKEYGTSRNDPSQSALSDLSPYFHFGHLAPQRACLEVRKLRNKYKESVESFLEECIIRRGSHRGFDCLNHPFAPVFPC